MRLVRSLPVLVAVLSLVLAGCATKKPPLDKPLITTIAVIPATEPTALTLENENGVMNFLVPISSVAFHLDSKGKAKLFNEQMAPRRMALAATLNATVIDALRSAGYQLEVLDKLERKADDPDDVDLEKINTGADMILQLRVDEVGLRSPKLTPDYLPQVDIQGKLYIKSRDDKLYDEDLHYGLGAKERDPQSIQADPKYAYPTFDAVLARQDEIQRVFESGVASLAQLLARQLQEALATKARRAPAPG